MAVKEITSLAQFKELIDSGKPVAFDFWAQWCGPCRAISPIFEKFSDKEEYNKVEFYKVNVDDQPQISEEVGIRAMPTFQVYKDGNKVDEFVGAVPAMLEQLIVKAATSA